MKKKILSLFLAVALLVAICAVIAGCNGNDDTTEPVVTTAPTDPQTTEPTKPQTTEPTKPQTTEPTKPQTTEPTKPQTTAPTEPQTTAPVQTTQAAPVVVLDFGKNSDAVKNGLSSYEYIMEHISYDSAVVNVTFTDNSMVLYSAKNAAASDITGNKFSVYFDNLTDSKYGTIKSGYGSYVGLPYYVTNDAEWQGAHQFMSIKIKNNTARAIAIKFSYKFEGTSSFRTASLSKTVAANTEATLVYDLVREVAGTAMSSTSLTPSRWANEVQNVAGVGFDFFGSNSITDKNGNVTGYVPAAGDNVEIFHVGFFADMDAAFAYGVPAAN